MTTFIDGPAKGQTMTLKRAPRFLRVTESARKFDALDQLDDVPASDEKLHAYEIVGQPVRGFICRRGGQGGAFAIASYRLVPDQPTDQQMRTMDQWHDWCLHKAGQATNHQPLATPP